MPLYTCITTAKTLADDTKAALAAEITKIHSSITGAPTSFVHVLFQELPATNVITNSSPSESLLITGVIRAGRADADRSLSQNCTPSRPAAVPSVSARAGGFRGCQGEPCDAFGGHRRTARVLGGVRGGQRPVVQDDECVGQRVGVGDPGVCG
jgi:phenylpyruvate tautomerase PptA (4-oxalocrotonate tautomerase family)